MVTLTMNFPDEKYTRLTQLAQHNNTGVNQLLDELTTRALAEFDAYTRFLSRASLGQIEEGLALLDKLDEHFVNPG